MTGNMRRSGETASTLIPQFCCLLCHLLPLEFKVTASNMHLVKTDKDKFEFILNVLQKERLLYL